MYTHTHFAFIFGYMKMIDFVAMYRTDFAKSNAIHIFMQTTNFAKRAKLVGICRSTTNWYLDQKQIHKLD